MIRPYLRPLAAASAAAYLLAGWLAAALHSHGDHSHAGEPVAVCTTCSCGHHHGPAKERHEAAEVPQGSEPSDCPEDGHHHCLVCDFLAKPPLPAAAVILVGPPGPVVEAFEPLAPAYRPAAGFPARSRGPPLFV